MFKARRLELTRALMPPLKLPPQGKKSNPVKAPLSKVSTLPCWLRSYIQLLRPASENPGSSIWLHCFVSAALCQHVHDCCPVLCQAAQPQARRGGRDY